MKSTMADLSKRQGQNTPLDLVPPRVAPRVRKSPQKHTNNRNIAISSPGKPSLIEQGNDQNAKSPSSVFDTGSLTSLDHSYHSEKTSIPAVLDDSSLFVSDVDLKELWRTDNPILKKEWSYTQASMSEIKGTSQDIKSRMLLSAERAALLKATVEKKPEPKQHCGSIEVIENTLGEIYNAGWLSSPKCGIVFASTESQNKSTIDVSPPQKSMHVDSLEQSKPQTQQSEIVKNVLHSPDQHLQTNPSKTESDQDKAETNLLVISAKLVEEVLTETSSSSCSSSTSSASLSSGGDLNSYRSMNCEKSTAGTAVTLQTIHEDEEEREKVVKEKVWKRLFRSRSQSKSVVTDYQCHILADKMCDGASVEANLLAGSFYVPENHILNEIHLQVDAIQEIHLSDEVIDPEAKVEESGVEAVLSSTSMDKISAENIVAPTISSTPREDTASIQDDPYNGPIMDYDSKFRAWWKESKLIHSEKDFADEIDCVAEIAENDKGSSHRIKTALTELQALVRSEQQDSTIPSDVLSIRMKEKLAMKLSAIVQEYDAISSFKEVGSETLTDAKTASDILSPIPSTKSEGSFFRRVLGGRKSSTKKRNL